VYVAILAPADGAVLVLGSVAMFGAYYACTDGVMSALASSLLPEETRTSGLALVGTATALASLFGSVLFGALWTAFGLETAVVTFLAGLVLSASALGVGLARTAAP
jgi:MFS family permease